ncbi:MAG: multicopper oxidase domain-containing protein [Actinomycetota bacterium]
MDAQHPPAPVSQVTEVVSVARLGTAIFSVVALMLSLGALIVANNNTGDSGTGQAGAVKATTSVLAASAIPSDAAVVSLTEFAMSPKMVMAQAGGFLKVSNDGAIPHTLAIEGTDLVTPTLNGKEAAGLSLASLEPGDYKVTCTIPGHQAAGMTGDLMVMAAGTDHGAAGGGPSSKTMTAEEMDAHMAVRTKAFPAKTEGLGAQILPPKVLADGTKQFNLTTKIVDWEIEPGKLVKAWTYNGVVPGPTLKADVGDKVRIVVNNELPESTAIHFHGLKTPNSMDGVPDITQEPIKPGTTFTYEFVAQGPAVGMYHSHQNAVVQVPNGLAGAFLVGKLPVPQGVTLSQELPMMLNDAGTIGFSLNGKSFPATAPIAVKPNEYVLVHYLNEGVMSHPMHLHGLIQTVIAKDGIPLAQPYDADTIMVGPGERYSVLIHADTPGVWAWHCHILTHAENEDGMFGMVTAMVVQ